MSENTILRATVRGGRTTAAGDCYNPNHNSRDSGIGTHVNREEMQRNRYLVWDGKCVREKKSEESFDAHEHAQYQRLFKKSLDAQNERYRARRQECRCLTIDQYRRRSRSCPEELILQIGNAADAVSRGDLKRAANVFLDQFLKKYGSSVVPLDIALHFDESSNHAHFRYVYTAEGKDGLEVSQKRALSDLGIQRPNPDDEETRYNNAKMTFSAQVRDMWIMAIERSTEYEVNRVPETPGHTYVEPATYRAEQALRETASEVHSLSVEREALMSQRDELIQETEKLAVEREQLQQEVAALREEKSRLQRITERIRASCMTLFKKLARVVCADGRCALEHVKTEAQAVLDAQEELIRDEIDTDER